MKERLQKIIASRGVASRRKAEEMILAGRVTVNGLVANLGDSADSDTEQILLDGKPLPAQQSHVYLMLNKPRGFVTTLSDEKGRRDITELIQDCPVRVYPVGRLDYDSEGLLLLTNDGKFAKRIMHPSHQVDKCYEVWVTGYHEAAVALISRPIELDGYRIKKPSVKLVWHRENQAKLFVTIHEGRNRQVRRMAEAAGMCVTRLRRIQEGNLKLDKLPLGAWRYLTDDEIAGLK